MPAVNIGIECFQTARLKLTALKSHKKATGKKPVIETI
jgi:hypothetical protein